MNWRTHSSCIAIACLALPVAMSISSSGWSQQDFSNKQKLDLTGYHRTFSEDFDQLSVSPWGPATRWIAHTPWNGDFGEARFADPTPGFPFSTRNGILTIEARKDKDGNWQSGLLAGHDLKGNGFAQKYGYFEMRAKLPSGKGVWPAFWLMGTERSRYAVEIDVMEFYGHDPTIFHSVYHVWSMDKVYPTRHVPQMIELDFDLTKDWHTFGVLVDPDTTTFFLDRLPYYQFATPPEFGQPLFPLVNLALGGDWPIAETPNPSFLYVDYVHIYSK